MAAVDNDGEGGQRERRMTMACKIGQRTTKGMDKSRRQETAETQSGNDGCGGGRWRRWTTMVAYDNNGNGGRRQRRWQMTTAVNDNNGTQDRVADYKGEGGEWAANN